MPLNPGSPTSSASISGSIAVYFDPSNPSVNATFSSASLEVVPSTGSRIMYDAASAASRVLIVGSQTNASLQVSGITNSIAVHLLSTNGTMAVNIGKTDGTVTVRFDPGYELGSIKGINTSAAVHIGSTGGTLAVKLDPGYNVVNMLSTAGIFTTSGSFNGVSTLGQTLVSPSASYNFKIFAYSLSTTGIVPIVAKFTNGAGSATEFWRLAMQAPASVSTGANFGVQPPGYLFATGVNVTLALVLDSATLVHYSVSYIKESA